MSKIQNDHCRTVSMNPWLLVADTLAYSDHILGRTEFSGTFFFPLNFWVLQRWKTYR
jgi:hypothetical protein